MASFVLILIFVIRPFYLPAETDIHKLEGKKRERRPRIFILLGLLGTCAAIAEASAGDWGGILSRDTFHASPLLASLPYVLFSVTMVSGRLSGDFLAHRFGVRRVIGIAGIIGGFGLSLGLFVGGTFGVCLGWVLLGVGISTVIPLMFSATGTIATEKYSGSFPASRAVALVSGVTYFGFIVGPPLIGGVAQLSTLRVAMLIPAALAITFSIASRKLLLGVG